jgi:hypothetical protein
MYIIYLDWMIVSDLEQEKTQAHRDCNILLEKNKDIIKVVYSPAHLQDILNSDKNFRPKHLSFLDTLTDKLYLDFDYIEKSTNFYTSSAHERISGYGDHFDISFLTPIKQLESYKNLGAESFGRFALSLFKLQPYNMELEIPDFEKNRDFYQKHFPTTLRENNMLSFMEDIGKLMDTIQNDPTLYNKLRDESMSILQLDPSEVSGFENPIEQLDNILLNSIFNKTF